MNTEKTAFEIISFAGDAKEELQKALKLIHGGKYEEAEELIERANGQLLKAHELQTQELLKRESSGEKLDFNVLISHAQDYLMTTYIFKDMVQEIALLYKAVK